LGMKFLRHIERTRALFHLISATSEDPAKDYTTVRNEMGTYNPLLLEKPEYVFLSKSDEADQTRLAEMIETFKNMGKIIWPISIISQDHLEPVKKILNQLAEEKHQLSQKSAV